MGNVKKYNLGEDLNKSQLIGQWDSTDEKLEELKKMVYERDKAELERAVENFMRHVMTDTGTDSETDEFFYCGEFNKDIADTCARTAARLLTKPYAEHEFPLESTYAIEKLFEYSSYLILDRENEKLWDVIADLENSIRQYSEDPTIEEDERAKKLYAFKKELEKARKKTDRIEEARIALGNSGGSFVNILCRNVIDTDEI